MWQTNVNDGADREARARCIQYIARFFSTNGIASNVANQNTTSRCWNL